MAKLGINFNRRHKNEWQLRIVIFKDIFRNRTLIDSFSLPQYCHISEHMTIPMRMFQTKQLRFVPERFEMGPLGQH
jgi:hypothetical protein